MSKFSNISILIRNRNEERWIGHCIQSVIEKFSKPEIIIIDDHSTDDSLNIAKSFCEDPNLEFSENYTKLLVTEVDQYSPGKSINLGVNMSSKDYVMVISAHCVLDKLNIEKHIKDLEEHVCVFGNQIPVRDGKKIIKRYVWSHFIQDEKVNMYSKMEERFFLHNALAIYKTSYLKEYPFNEILRGKEDRYWANNVVSNGFSYLYDPNLSAYHHYTENGATWIGLG